MRTIKNVSPDYSIGIVLDRGRNYYVIVSYKGDPVHVRCLGSVLDEINWDLNHKVFLELLEIRNFLFDNGVDLLVSTILSIVRTMLDGEIPFGKISVMYEERSAMVV